MSEMNFNVLKAWNADQAKKYFRTDKFIVRLYDGFDNQWIDCNYEPLNWDDAQALLMKKTKNGTERTQFSDVDYYFIFPWGSRMLYSEGFGDR